MFKVIQQLLFLLIVSSLCGFIFTGCDNAFQPFQENDQYHFSIYGYLDASADTQWVRVIPVRKDFVLDPDKPIDAEASLEHIESGETVMMNDSLTSFAHGVFAYNFWTTMDLQPEQTYLLAVKRSDGKASHVTVTLPPDFPVPAAIPEYTSTTFPIHISTAIALDGVKRLADVQTIYSGFLPSGEPFRFEFIHLMDSAKTSSGDYRVTIDLRGDQQTLRDFDVANLVKKSQIFIASAGPDYHHFSSINERIIPLPEGVSNIENGTGYLAGIVSKTIPLESCTKDGSLNEFIPCEPEPPPW